MRRTRGDLQRLQAELRRRLHGQPEPAARRPPPLAGTSIERAVAELLADWRVPSLAQHRLLPGVTVDFFLPQHGVVIECQGTWYHADPTVFRGGQLTAAQRRKRRHDAALRHCCEHAGLALLEVWEKELDERPEWCATWLRVQLGLAGREVLMSRRVCCFTTPQGVRLAVHDGDLTTETVDAIVNAANSHLAHGGGVAGAIVRRGGQAIQDESDAWVREHGPVPTGQAALTGAGTLACRAVIHAVGPIWRTGDVEPAQLRSAVINALALAAAQGFESVALPAISSGIFGFPKERCASVLVEAALEFSGAAGSVREIRFTNFDGPTVEIFAEEFARRFGERLEPGWEEPR